MAMVERVVLAGGSRLEVTRRSVERGFGNIKRSVLKYRQASHAIPHVVLTDLDRGECPAALRAAWGASGLPASMMFRVAVRATESWILADRDGFAGFAGVALNKMPARPEELIDPKATLLGLVRRSRNRRLIAELVPAAGSAARIGPLYNQRLIAFVAQAWDIEAASAVCPSLMKMRVRLGAFLN